MSKMVQPNLDYMGNKIIYSNKLNTLMNLNVIEYFIHRQYCKRTELFKMIIDSQPRKYNSTSIAA